MILIISGIILGLSILFTMTKYEGLQILGIAGIIISLGFGFLLMGILFPIETEIIVPDDAFMEKNESSIVLVVPNVGNRVITNPAVIRYIDTTDTIKVRYDYNSYGGKVDNIKIYVEKDGWRY